MDMLVPARPARARSIRLFRLAKSWGRVGASGSCQEALVRSSWSRRILSWLAPTVTTGLPTSEMRFLLLLFFLFGRAVS